MKLEIYGKPEQSDDLVRLQLRLNPDGSVALLVVDAAGNRYSSGGLLTITRDGCIQRHTAVSESLGFRLNAKGRVVVEDF